MKMFRKDLFTLVHVNAFCFGAEPIYYQRQSFLSFPVASCMGLEWGTGFVEEMREAQEGEEKMLTAAQNLQP